MLFIKNPALLIKKLIIFFFIYMVLEGVFRKWILPDFQVQIYFLKDFFLIIIYFLALKYNFLFKTKYSKFFSIFIIIITLYGLIGYDFNFEGILSFILGTRSYWLYAPLALIIIHLFKQDDLIKFFEINLFFVFPYFFLTLIQVYSSDASIINSGFNSIVFNPERPSGYFTYTTQNTYYLLFLCLCYYISLLSISKFSKKKIIYFIALNFMLMSIMILLKSRAVYVFSFAIIIYSLFFLIFLNENYKIKIKKFIFILLVTILSFSYAQKIFKNDFQFSVKRINTDTYLEMTIFQVYSDKNLYFSNKTLGDLCKKHSSICRVINEIYFFPEISKATLFGKGIGAGTAAVSFLNKEKNFSLGEAENHRIINELGYVMGTLFVLAKFILVLIIHILFLFKIKQKANFSPMLVFVSVQLLIAPITFSVSFISFIFWFCFGLFFVSLNSHHKSEKNNL